MKLADKIIDRIATALSFALGLGLSPVMPGTVGSIPGLGLGALIRGAADVLPPEQAALRVGLMTSLLGATAVFAWWAIHRTERALGIHDDQRIVIDEVVGQAIAVAFVPVSWPWYGAGFVLFRLLDMTKPSVIGRIDRETPGALGTLGDDVVAGLVAAAILIGVRQFL